MPPTSSETGLRNSSASGELYLLNKQHQKGYDALPQKEKTRFAHICPDFVIEIISLTDDLRHARAKMQEWMSQGALLGWLLYFEEKKAWVYDKDSVKQHSFDQPLAGTGPVEGFRLMLPSL